MNIRFAAAAVAALTVLAGCGGTTIVSPGSNTVDEEKVEVMATVFQQYDPQEQSLMCTYWSFHPEDAYASLNRSVDTGISIDTFNVAMKRNCS